MYSRTLAVCARARARGQRFSKQAMIWRRLYQLQFSCVIFSASAEPRRFSKLASHWSFVIWTGAPAATAASAAAASAAAEVVPGCASAELLEMRRHSISCHHNRYAGAVARCTCPLPPGRPVAARGYPRALVGPVFVCTCVSRRACPRSVCDPVSLPHPVPSPAHVPYVRTQARARSNCSLYHDHKRPLLRVVKCPRTGNLQPCQRASPLKASRVAATEGRECSVTAHAYRQRGRWRADGRTCHACCRAWYRASSTATCKNGSRMSPPSTRRSGEV